MPPISVLIKPSSGMCNMKCDYCFYCDEMKKRMRESYGFMTEQTLKNVIRKTMFHAEGMISYAYQGCLLYTSTDCLVDGFQNPISILTISTKQSALKVVKILNANQRADSTRGISVSKYIYTVNAVSGG